MFPAGFEVQLLLPLENCFFKLLGWLLETTTVPSSGKSQDSTCYKFPSAVGGFEMSPGLLLKDTPLHVRPHYHHVAKVLEEEFWKSTESHQEAQILKDKECSGKGIKLRGPPFGQQET